jgi:hypothetical protein
VVFHVALLRRGDSLCFHQCFWGNFKGWLGVLVGALRGVLRARSGMREFHFIVRGLNHEIIHKGELR